MTGIELKETREELGLSQEELASRFGISIEDLQGLEREGKISKVLEFAMNWIQFEMLRPSDEELTETYRKVEETLKRTEKYI
jgi:transcriptional regulator with XRE-family HTH domain